MSSKNALTIAELLRTRGLFVKIVLRPDDHKAKHKYMCEITESDGTAFGANGDSLLEVLEVALEAADTPSEEQKAAYRRLRGDS